MCTGLPKLTHLNRIMERMVLVQNLTTQKSLWASLVFEFSTASVWGWDAKEMRKLPSGTLFSEPRSSECVPLFYISLLWTTFSGYFAVSARETSISFLGKVIPCISNEIKPFTPWYLTYLFLHLDVPSLENANLTVWNAMRTWESPCSPFMPVPTAPLSITHC